MFRGIETNMKGGESLCCLAFHFIIRYFQSALFLREMSLSFVEDGLSSASPLGLCLLVGPTRGQKKTTVEKNKCECTNTLITWAHAQRYIARTNTHMHGGHTVNETSCLFREVEKMHTSVKIDTCRCPHLESLWDTGGRLFLLSVWWATGRHGPAWTHRRGAPGPEEGGVAGG